MEPEREEKETRPIERGRASSTRLDPTAGAWACHASTFGCSGGVVVELGKGCVSMPPSTKEDQFEREKAVRSERESSTRTRRSSPSDSVDVGWVGRACIALWRVGLV